MTPCADKTTATFIVVSETAASEQVQGALCAAATALGHAAAPVFIVTGEARPEELGLFVHEVDPWSVVAIDKGACDAIKSAFPGELQELAPDSPAVARGYRFVFVPEFQECLDDLAKKRTAWERLKAARYPDAPL